MFDPRELGSEAYDTVVTIETSKFSESPTVTQFSGPHSERFNIVIAEDDAILEGALGDTPLSEDIVLTPHSPSRAF